MLNYKRLTEDVIFYSALPLIIINVIGNLLCVIVFIRKKFQKTSTGFYLSCLAIADLFQTYLLIGYYLQQYHIILSDVSGVMCKLNGYLYNTLPLYPAWILVVITVDRALAMCSVNNIAFLNKKSFQMTVIAVIGIVLALPNLVQLIIFQIETVTTQSNITHFQCGTSRYMLSQQVLFYNCLLSITLIPFALMSTANFISIMKLFKSKKNVNSNAKFSQREMRFSGTLIAQNIIFLIHYVPVCVLMIVTDTDYSISLKDNTEHFSETFYVVFYIGVYIRHAHSCIQFVVYIFVNSLFRGELFAFVKEVSSFTTQSKRFRNKKCIGTTSKEFDASYILPKKNFTPMEI